MNATATTTAPAQGSARTVGIALVFVIGAAVAGIATGTILQQAIADPSSVVVSQAAVNTMHDMLARDRAAEALALQNATNWPDYAIRHRAPVSDTFRFTGPSRIQIVAGLGGLGAALATEAYGTELVQRMTATNVGVAAALATEAYGTELVQRAAAAAAAAAQANEDWPDYALRHRAPASETFRFTGPSHVE